jgi:fructokinase
VRSRSTPETARRATVACFGEILWDCLPRGLFLGGAPCNAAYHLSRHGVRAFLLSAVGRDFLGDEAVRRLAGWGLDTRFLTRHRRWPTGVVRATLNAAGAASYRILQRVAWDHIPISRALRHRPAPDALVYGTLALREPANRRALTQLFAAWPGALRVVDLNLRPPFDRPGGIAFALRQAQLVKLNDLELGQLLQRPVATPRALERAARQWVEQGGSTRLCVTAGARGAGLLWDGRWFWQKARPVVVRDTVGAGDAFLGGLLAGLLAAEADPARALQRACRAGEFVAARDGATPPYQIGFDGRLLPPRPGRPAAIF